MRSWIAARHTMRPWLVAISVAMLALASGCAYVPSVSDEFNGPAGPVDAGKWAMKQWCNVPAKNGTDSCFRADTDHVYVDGRGHLVIRAIKGWTDPRGGVWRGWTTGHIASKQMLAPPYLIAVRAKVPAGYGFWAAPAWATDETTHCAEVDVLEQLGRQPSAVNQSLHGCSIFRTDYVGTGTTLADGFHTYGAYVQRDRVTYFVDRRQTARIRAADVGANLGHPHTFHISLNVGTCDGSASWAGCPQPSVGSAANMVVDWFRVYSLP